MIYPARHYPAKFRPAPEGGFVVTFRDVPEAITQGEEPIEAIAMAVDCLYSAREFYTERNDLMNEPSARQDGEVLIPLYVDDRDEEMQLFGVDA
jgi:antitoxin HicB